MDAIYDAHELMTRSGGAPVDPNRPPVYKVVGICLAIASGVFIGISFVLKKVGLLKANEKYNEVAGEGYGYLKNWYWWAGMTLMIVGEICNFVAYAFVDAILVTPLGALSVVITTILSAIFLKERLSFVGKVGCFNCIIGSVVIVLNAPAQSAVADIQQMQHYVIAPGFLSYAGVVIVGCTFVAWWAGPRYGKKSMLVYLSICSLIGGLSVVATQGLGSAVVAQAGGKPQFNQWFLYVLLVFVVATLLTEIIYLNKALNIFNAALVTPTYYVFFTSATILTSAILFRGFKGTAIQITTVIMGFFQICAGVILLQLSKSSKDVPDAAVFNGDLDQIRQVGEQEQPETEPKADAIRGAAALVRRFSSARQKMEQREFERLHQEKMQDQLEPVGENEVVQWDGLRRRKTVIGDHPGSPLVRRKTLHPPLGMAYFPEEDDDDHKDHHQQHGTDHRDGVLSSMRSRASTMFSFQRHQSPRPESTIRPVPMTEIVVSPSKGATEAPPPSESETEPETALGVPAALRKSSLKPLWSPRSKPLPPHPESSPHQSITSPPPSARRQWSFTNFIGRNRTPTYADGAEEVPASLRGDLASRGSTFSREKQSATHATEEERLGLVKGDSVPSFLMAPSASSPLEPPPVYPPPAHKPLHTTTPSFLSGGAHDATDPARLPASHHPREYSTIPEESDTGDAFQMTNRHDADDWDPHTVTAIATATERARSSMRKLVTPPPTAVISSTSERHGTRSRQRPSPPPTYRQAQAQAHERAQHRDWTQPPSSRSLAAATRTSQPPFSSSLEPERSQETDPLQVPEVISQAQRGRVLERGVARIVQASDRSRSSSTSQNRTRTRGENTNKNDNIMTEEDDELQLSAPRQRRTPPEQTGLTFNSSGAVVFGRRAIYEGQGHDSPMLGEISPTALPRHASPELVDQNASETKDRFEARSRREREKRRTRMNFGTSNAQVSGMI